MEDFGGDIDESEHEEHDTEEMTCGGVQEVEEVHACAECDFQAGSWDEFMNHSSLFHLGNRDVTTPESSNTRLCPHCGVAVNSESSMQKHIAVKHDRIGGFRCADCDFMSVTKTGLRQHIERKHSVQVFPCARCGERFDTVVHLNKHLFRIHGDTKFKCPRCDFIASRVPTLRMHIDRKHERVVSYACSHCSYTSDRARNVKRHTRAHHTDKARGNKKNAYKCEFCEDYVTSTRADLVRHVQDVHKQEKLYYCDSCSFSSYWKKCLWNHSYLYHKKVETQVFGCQYCSFEGRSEELLKKHIYKLHMISLVCEDSLV